MALSITVSSSSHGGVLGLLFDASPCKKKSDEPHNWAYNPIRLVTLVTLLEASFYWFLLVFYLLLGCDWEDSLGDDSDKGTPDDAALRPKSPCTSSRILSAFRALILVNSSGREVNAVSTCRGLSCQGY